MTEKRTIVEAPVEESGAAPKQRPKGEEPTKAPPEPNPAPHGNDPGNTGGAPVDEIDFDGNGQRSQEDRGGEPDRGGPATPDGSESRSR